MKPKLIWSNIDSITKLWPQFEYLGVKKSLYRLCNISNTADILWSTSIELYGEDPSYMNAGSETKSWNMETVMWWFVQRRGNRWAQSLSVKIIKHYHHLSSRSPTNSVLTWHLFSPIVAFGFIFGWTKSNKVYLFVFPDIFDIHSCRCNTMMTIGKQEKKRW